VALHLPYRYTWQNPYLRETIYPFRLQKLRDFLLVYEEIDIWQRLKNAPVDPALAQEIQQNLPALQTQLQDYLRQRKTIEEAIRLLDKKLTQIERVSSIRNLILQISRLEIESRQLNLKRRLLEGYIQWSLKIAPNNDPVRPRRQAELEQVQSQLTQIAEQIASLKQEYDDTFLPLKEQEDKLETSLASIEDHIADLTAQLQGFPPLTANQPVTPKIAARWLLNHSRKHLEELDHDKLLELILERFQSQPERFPGWLQYMVIHFSGMRYKSAHGSWADPRLLLRKILEEELEQRINTADEDQLLMAVGEIIASLGKLLEQPLTEIEQNHNKRWIQKLSILETTRKDLFRSQPAAEEIFDGLRQAEKKIASLSQLFTTMGIQPNHMTLRMIADLEEEQRLAIQQLGWSKVAEFKKRLAVGLYWLKKNLLAYRLERMEDEIERMTDLEILSDLAIRKAQVPTWAWNEIIRRTDLRLVVTDTAWETSTRQEYQEKFQNNAANQRWRQIIHEWQSRDITAWRGKHAQDLSLVVSRAVCNEISEHIQHLRGRIPPGGLTAKPRWYLANQDAMQGKAFFKRPEIENDFLPGGSLFFLGWVSSKPHAWAICSPLSQFSLIMPDGKPLANGRSDALGKYQYIISGNEIYRTSQVDVEVIPATPIPEAGIKSMRKQVAKGKKATTASAIQRAKKKPKKFRKQARVEWLRWTHEAMVVEVAEMIDGVNVLTFETGEIGLNIRPYKRLVKQWDVYIGYVPPAETERPELAGYLDPVKIRSGVITI
jgi:hypothetical protein